MFHTFLLADPTPGRHTFTMVLVLGRGLCVQAVCAVPQVPPTFFFSFFFFQTGSLPGLRLTKEAGLASYAARDPLVSTSLVLGSFWEWSSASSAFKASILMAEPSPQPKGSPFPPRSSTLLCVPHPQPGRPSQVMSRSRDHAGGFPLEHALRTQNHLGKKDPGSPQNSSKDSSPCHPTSSEA